MAANRKLQRMTVDEWRELERTSHDIKHEYIDGYVYAITGGSCPHSRIGSDSVRAFEDMLAIAGMSCYVYNSDMAVRVSESRYIYPDTSITCDERDRPLLEETEIFYPRVIVEVLQTLQNRMIVARSFFCIAHIPLCKSMWLLPRNINPLKSIDVLQKVGQTTSSTALGKK